MAATTRGAFPYPISTTAPPAVHLDIKALADQAAVVGALYAQGVHASRPAAASANQGMLYKATDGNKHLYYSDGSVWTKVDQLVDRRVASDGFPSAVDGDMIEFAIAQAGQFAADVAWQFVYEAGLGDAYKWKFVGGPPFLSDTGAATYSFTPSGGTPWGFTSAPSCTLPFAGYYRIRGGARISPDTTDGYIKVGIGVTGTVDAASIGSAFAQRSGLASSGFTCEADCCLLVASAGVVVSLGISGASTNPLTAQRRWLEVTPLRVSP